MMKKWEEVANGEMIAVLCAMMMEIDDSEYDEREDGGQPAR